MAPFKIENSYNMQTEARAVQLHDALIKAFGHAETFSCQRDGSCVKVSYQWDHAYQSTEPEQALENFYAAQKREQHRKKENPTLGDHVWAFMNERVGGLFTAANAERARTGFNPSVPLAGK